MEKVRSLDDASIYYLSSLPCDSFRLLEKVFSMYAEGGIKSQSCPRGSMGKKLDLKGSNFKPMRGLDISTVTSLLEQLTKEELSIPEMAKECKKVKSLRDLQKAFIDETGVQTWKEAEEKFPSFASAEAFDQFIEGNTKKAIDSHRFKSFCKSALHSVECAETISPSDGIFQHERSTAYVLPTQTISYSSINSLCSTSRMPFKGFALTLINFSDLNTDEGETLEVLVRSIRSINTMSGAMTFVIGVVCDHESYPDVVSALGSMNKLEVCYVYSEGIKNSGVLIGTMDVLCVAQYGEASWNHRERLFTNERMVEVKDDQGKPISSHADWTEQTYCEIIESFSEKDDFVYFPRIVSVEGVVASLKAGRNCTALGSATMKLFAQRKVMSRIMEESKRSEDEQIEEDIAN